jgi:ribosomal protein L40E
MPMGHRVATTTLSDRPRSHEHRRFVGSLRCMVCYADPPSDAHHLKFQQPRAMSLKAGDQWTVPLCRRCHTLVELAGDEAGWWRSLEIDPIPLATELWQLSLERTGGTVDGSAPTGTSGG